jgi:Zn-dependent protease
LVAFCAALLFFASVLLHELSHALVGRTQGVTVRRITLFLFGGIAHMEHEPPSARAELLMTIVGPITSLILGVVATFLGIHLAGGEAVQVREPMELAREAGPIATLLLWLGPVNVGLALFNMSPGFPLDGGRALRALLWAITGSLTNATRWSAAIGRGFAWLLMAIGAIDVVGGAWGQGLWLVLIGWFLNNAALASYQRVLVAQALANVPVARLMRTQVDAITPDTTVEELVRQHLIASEQHGFPVAVDGELLGLVTRDDVRRVPHSEWQTTRVDAIMTPSDRLSTVTANAAADDALSELARRDVDQIPVVEGRHLLGMVLRRDLLQWVALHETHA